MKARSLGGVVVCLCGFVVAACASAPPAKPPAAATSPVRQSEIHQTPPGLGQYPYSDADVAFMTGMIPHHAQAVIMAGWAPSHGARQDVAVLCERIVVAQRDEITLMQNWLRDRGLPVPDASSTRMKMSMGGMEHDMLMPGMLTDEEMAALDRARGPEFDRLFLLGMIKHHQGAIDMVDTLFKSYGAAQDEMIFKFANDVFADQSTEIDRMKQMLAEVPTGGGGAPE
jgi:uncharacterized protein (DUF305 family)